MGLGSDLDGLLPEGVFQNELPGSGKDLAAPKRGRWCFCYFIRPQYHLPELPQLNTQRVPGSTGQAGQAGSDGLFIGFIIFRPPAHRTYAPVGRK